MVSKPLMQPYLMLISTGLVLVVGLAPATAQQEIRIGLIAPMTGQFAQTGTDMTNGFKMYLD
jgi:branched-chain amino acid transport system substrate-binding protein